APPLGFLPEAPPCLLATLHLPLPVPRAGAGARGRIMTRHFDVIIIGSGAGGGTLFRALAPTGKPILLLERGDYVPREKDNWSTKAVNLEGKYNTKETWYDAGGGALHPHTNYFVGGNTKF